MTGKTTVGEKVGYGIAAIGNADIFDPAGIYYIPAIAIFFLAAVILYKYALSKEKYKELTNDV